MNTALSHRRLSPLQATLEDEAIYVIREAFGQFERPILLFSGGKDSIVLATLAARAFHPDRIPFPLVHIDTGHNFQETLDYRDAFAERLGVKLIVKRVQDSIDQGRVSEESGPNPSRNALQTTTLLDAIQELKADAALGGARRDEEKARAKERFFSHRDQHGQWDPKNQRPELWGILNGLHHRGEHFRVFPLSNWTELDIWEYIEAMQIPLPTLYFAHKRRVYEHDGVLLAETPFTIAGSAEQVTERLVRFRTIGDATCTGAIESEASTVAQIIAELKGTRTSERSVRGDDKRSEAAMEDRKRQGYF